MRGVGPRIDTGVKFAFIDWIVGMQLKTTINVSKIMLKFWNCEYLLILN